MKFQDVRFEEAARVAARRAREAGSHGRRDAYLLALERIVEAQEDMDGLQDPELVRIEQNAFIRASLEGR